MTLIEKVTRAFEQHFKLQPTSFFRAPGRVNLLGDHTDYNDGFVLPCAIDFETIVAGNKRQDHLVRVFAIDYQQQDCFDLNAPIVKNNTYQWADYVRGVAKSLQDKGLNLVGCDLVIGGNLPQGAGLSSSASLEVALGLAYSSLANEYISAKDNALCGQYAENNFVGCKCGIMDQLISAQGVKNKALLIDCRSLDSELVSIPESLSIVIINSNVKRGLVDSEYNIRRSQCEEAAKYFGVPTLRDVDWEQFKANEDGLGFILAKRARHVLTENYRTKVAAKALADNDIARLSFLMAESHQSMKDDFQVTVPEIDYLVDIISDRLGSRGGVRITGGGFGGCVVALVPSDLVNEIAELVEKKYTKKTTLKPDVFVCVASQGAEVIS